MHFNTFTDADLTLSPHNVYFANRFKWCYIFCILFASLQLTFCICLCLCYIAQAEKLFSSLVIMEDLNQFKFCWPLAVILRFIVAEGVICNYHSRSSIMMYFITSNLSLILIINKPLLPYCHYLTLLSHIQNLMLHIFIAVLRHM